MRTHGKSTHKVCCPLNRADSSSEDATDSVKIIDPAWFTRMRGDNGDTCHWESRNVKGEIRNRNNVLKRRYANSFRDLESIPKSRSPKTRDSLHGNFANLNPLRKTANPWRQLQESLKLFPDPPSDREILEERQRRVREAQLITDQGSHDPDSDDSMSCSASTQSDAQRSFTPDRESEKLTSPAIPQRQEEGVAARSGIEAFTTQATTTTPSTKSPVSNANNRLHGYQNQKVAATMRSSTPTELPSAYQSSETKLRKEEAQYSGNKNTVKELTHPHRLSKNQRTHKGPQKAKVAALARLHLHPDYLPAPETEREHLVAGKARNHDDKFM